MTETVSTERLTVEEIVERMAWKLCAMENEVWDETSDSYKARYRREASQMLASKSVGQIADALVSEARTQEPADWRAVVTDIRDLCSRRPALSGRTKDEITSVALSNSADLAHIMRLCNSLLKMPRAATPPAPERKGVGVKPLEWHERVTGVHRAETIVGDYRVWTHHEADGVVFWQLSDGGVKAAGQGTEAECFAAAQADYEQRIRSALSKPGDQG